MEAELVGSTGKINSVLGTLRTDLLPLDHLYSLGKEDSFKADRVHIVQEREGSRKLILEVGKSKTGKL